MPFDGHPRRGMTYDSGLRGLNAPDDLFNYNLLTVADINSCRQIVKTFAHVTAVN